METATMPNRRYKSGVNLEREIRQILEESFGISCLRTAGSKGDFDLVALGSMHTLLIQVKYTSRKNLEPPRTLIETLKKYVTIGRWAVIIVVQRQTRRTSVTWLDKSSILYDMIGSTTVDYHKAMLVLNQLCTGYEIEY
jgi:Holliday junction resolvase